MKKYKCLKQFPEFVCIINKVITSCPGRNVGEIFSVMDMKNKPYLLLLKNNYIVEVDLNGK